MLKNKYITKRRIVSLVTATLVFIGSRILSLFWSRFDDWGNSMIDSWLSSHGHDTLTWVLRSPLNLISALCLITVLIIVIDWYLQNRTREIEHETAPRNIPPEFYVPSSEELKHKINIDTQKFYYKFKSFVYSSGQNRSYQYEIAMKIIKEIVENLLPHAKRLLKDTQIPNLIDEIHTEMVSFWIKMSMLEEEYREKNKFISGKLSVPKETQDRIEDLEMQLDQIIDDIDCKTNQLIDLTNGIGK